MASYFKLNFRYFLDLNPSDVFWNLSDTGWAKCAWSSLFAPWIAGACVFAQDAAKFDPQQTIKVGVSFLKQSSFTWFHMVMTKY